jgi:pimeloyl-ACP methyl ester carboxylesterase
MNLTEVAVERHDACQRDASAAREVRQRELLAAPPQRPRQEETDMPDDRRDEQPRIQVNGIGIELSRHGTGRPLLFLHPHIGLDRSAPFIGHLAAQASVIAPSHPGFGHSELPRYMTTVDDLAYFYLDLLETLDLRDTIVVGVSFGGWLAAEIAIKSTERISHLVLADAVGIKIGDRETRDIVDIFARKQSDIDALSYHAMKPPAVDAAAMSDDDALVMFRNAESTALFAWSPYMHNPKLASRLHRIRVPTLVLWGAGDRIASPAYGRAYSGMIPAARFVEIAEAGHYPHLEQPEVFARKIADFVGSN